MPLVAGLVDIVAHQPPEIEVADRRAVSGQFRPGQHRLRGAIAKQGREKVVGDQRCHDAMLTYRAPSDNDFFERICPLVPQSAVLPQPASPA